MEIFRSADKMRGWAAERVCGGSSLALVPTMGALHKAHRSLISRAVSENDVTVVSIFVNPTQFAPGEDYESYPHNFENDRNMCSTERVDAIFNPSVEEMYGEADLTRISVQKITDYMCGAYRPGHFEGVATVVSKLFNIIRPVRAYFGCKDYQQLQVIKTINRDLKMGVNIVECQTVRDEDGLALSSRNRYLDSNHRQQASHIYRALLQGRETIERGETDGEKISGMIKGWINKKIPDCDIDYAGVYDAYDLHPVKEVKRDVVLAAALKLGRARLIDNIPLKVK